MKIILGVFYNEEQTFQKLKEKFDLVSFVSFGGSYKPTNWDYEDHIKMERFYLSNLANVYAFEVL